VVSARRQPDFPAVPNIAQIRLRAYLPPWHLIGWQQKTLLEKLRAFLYPPRPPVQHKPKKPVVALLGKLPEREAPFHWRKLDALGAFS